MEQRTETLIDQLGLYIVQQTAPKGAIQISQTFTEDPMTLGCFEELADGLGCQNQKLPTRESEDASRQEPPMIII